ncbi:hypothetical protein JC796_26500 [Delftia acidovorans]|uniref:hypothetical protein n=1 Tax=Delftia acidovorans TaxID=80866 RepID=UPI0018E8B5C1|nr:hypothetical protein [Delftia acidovorans]MBJ2144309.1 hypothetical protein [Delftia acidovorans]
MFIDLTDAQLQHFAGTVVWLSMCGGALGALAFGLFMSLITRAISSVGNWMDRRTRIYTARMRATALHRINSNG